MPRRTPLKLTEPGHLQDEHRAEGSGDLGLTVITGLLKASFSTPDGWFFNYFPGLFGKDKCSKVGECSMHWKIFLKLLKKKICCLHKLYGVVILKVLFPSSLLVLTGYSTGRYCHSLTDEKNETHSLCVTGLNPRGLPLAVLSSLCPVTVLSFIITGRDEVT